MNDAKKLHIYYLGLAKLVITFSVNDSLFYQYVVSSMKAAAYQVIHHGSREGVPCNYVQLLLVPSVTGLSSP